ncbi:MAG: SpoVA/SpoVAEb family sporulation membrane protein [Firmicutes bacterium]|nr:SpoVA/SpoVAEb family sporulation membrane protein [Bacillota bacterium]
MMTLVFSNSQKIFKLILKIHQHVKNPIVDETKKRNEQYSDYVNQVAPKSRYFPSLIWAFLIGGLISMLGESLYMFFSEITNYNKEGIGALVATTLIILASILTALGLYDKLGAFSGGGSIIPITGFSNAITATAIEHRKEGLVFGTCANMFKIAGPVIVVGVALSMLVGLIYWIISLF